MSKELSDRSVKSRVPSEADDLAAARLELKRAYVQLGFGQFDEAIASCRAAASLSEGHFLPDTLRGTILSARGAHKEAMGVLKAVMKKHPDQALPQLYFAEACFLLGRTRQGQKALDDAGQCTMTSDEAELFDQLTDVWTTVDAAEIPPPLKPTL